MLYVFYGPDQFRARDELQKVRRDLDSAAPITRRTTAGSSPRAAMASATVPSVNGSRASCPKKTSFAKYSPRRIRGDTSPPSAQDEP